MNPASPRNPHATPLPRPGLLYGAYPQRPAADSRASARLWRGLAHALPFAHLALGRRTRRFEQQLAACGAEPLGPLRAELSRHGLTDALVARALRQVGAAIERESAGGRARAPYPGQYRAAWAMLDQRLVEMDTGEGKSLAMLMAAAVAALAGVPVHVVTANDYLAQRDADAARPVLAALGLRVAAIQNAHDPAERRAAYRCDVVYCSARELGFDHLRDLAGGLSGDPDSASAPVLRGLCMALLDEADSVLIDHARMPLVLARPAPGQLAPAQLQALWARSGGLIESADFVLDPARRAVRLAPAVTRALGADGGDRRLAAQGLRDALVARHLLRRGRDYLVEDGAIVLIDPATGRCSPGTQWSRGLQALVSFKEGCEAPMATLPAAQITLQALFSRYWRLGGASGTLREARLELAAIYGLGVLRIAARQRSLRHPEPVRLYADDAAHAQAVGAAVQRAAQRGQPVLVGTASVAACEAWGDALQALGLPVQRLDARHAADEVARLQRSGAPGRVTVTTQVAGRGADIAPDAAALRHGGLHVVRTAFQRNARLDRQLVGRSARNGQPGSAEALLSLQSPELAAVCPRFLRDGLAALARILNPQHCLPAPLAAPLLAALQAALALGDLHARWQQALHEAQSRQALAYTREHDTRAR